MKGVTKTLEVVIAVLMVLISYVLLYSAPIIPPDFQSINLQLQAFNSLQTLDANNELRQAALQNDTSTISNKLAGILSGNVNYLVSICTSACAAPVFNSTSIFSVSYIISGDVGNFNPRQVIVYMWS